MDPSKPVKSARELFLGQALKLEQFRAPTVVKLFIYAAANLP